MDTNSAREALAAALENEDTAQAAPIEQPMEDSADPAPVEEPAPQVPAVDVNTNTAALQPDPIMMAQQALNAYQSENAMLRQQLQQAQRLQAETQKANEQTVTQIISAPVFPQIEFDGADDAARTAILNKYNQEMSDYTGNIAAQRLKPIEDQFRQQTQAAEESAAVNGIIESGRFHDFKDKIPEIKQTLQSMPQLQNIPPAQRYLTAYLLLKGNEALTAQPVKKTTEEQLREVESNPELLKALEAKKIMAVKQNGEVPTHVISGGVGNVAATMPPQGPKSIDEVKEHIMKTRFQNGEFRG